MYHHCTNYRIYLRKDLTIYCYEGSTVAEYAIKYNIKYVYLQKSSISNNDTGSDTESKSVKASKDDTTISNKILPNAGSSLITLLAIAIIFGIGIFTYKKYAQINNIVK